MRGIKLFKVELTPETKREKNCLCLFRNRRWRSGIDVDPESEREPVCHWLMAGTIWRLLFSGIDLDQEKRTQTYLICLVDGGYDLASTIEWD